jgi:CPA2 family monovalent cation:H+ antiporter-2
MELQLLQDITLVLGLSILVLYVFHKLRIPLIIGFLLSGILAGPHGIGLVTDIHDIEVLAEIGVILLLFTIGIEFSLSNLVRIRKTLLLGGSFQVVLTIAATTAVALWIGNPLNESIFIGFLIALSSTAIVLKLIQDKGELETPHGRTAVGILIFQDLVIVPMILFTPFLAGNAAGGGTTILLMVLKFIAVIIFVILGSRYLVPKVFDLIAKTQSRELFILSVLVIAFLVAFLTSSLGLSLALGAFLAGLMVSESEYSQNVLGNVIPFLHVFTSFFFISIGMMLDVNYVFSDVGNVLIFTAIVLTLKTFIASLAAYILGYPLRTALIVGFTLSQVGEFSFILSKIGIAEGLLSGENYQLFLSVSVLSMAATPFVIIIASRAGEWLSRVPVLSRMTHGIPMASEPEKTELKDHTIIIGYGINGRNVSHAARFAKIPHIIIEINPDTVKRERKNGENIFYGDATHEEVLEHAFIKQAKILVITLPGTGDALRITHLARDMNPKLCIIIRTRFILHMEDLFKAGANEVIPEEFETSVEIFTRVLDRYGIEREQIDKLVTDIRSDNYEMFRTLSIFDQFKDPRDVEPEK